MWRAPGVLHRAVAGQHSVAGDVRADPPQDAGRVPPHISPMPPEPTQLDLFPTEAPGVPGLGFAADLVTEAEERALIAAIDAVELPHFSFQGWTARRRARSFGWRYDFEAGDFGPADPVPAFLLPFRARAAAFARMPDDALVQASIIRYDPGAGIGWHVDRPEFGDVLGVSLGAAAVMRFRRRREGGFDRAALPLPPRSLYCLAGEARRGWEHGIAPIGALRWSITFRGLAGTRPSDARAPIARAGR
jgi:alkylated DNA repair protein (DNA oxidative demethylase)